MTAVGFGAGADKLPGENNDGFDKMVVSGTLLDEVAEPVCLGEGLGDGIALGGVAVDGERFSVEVDISLAPSGKPGGLRGIYILREP